MPGYTKVEGRAWGPLNEKFVLDKYADDLKGFVETMTPTGGIVGKLDAAQGYMMNFFKVSKTVLNPATHMRNILGNAMFADYAGIPVWDPRNFTYYTRAANELLQSGKGLTAKGIREAKLGKTLTD